MITQIPSFLKNENFWLAVVAIIYIFSGVTDVEVNWQVVIVVASYIGGTSLKDSVAKFLNTIEKIDAILDRAGIHWEDVLEDALKKLKDGDND